MLIPLMISLSVGVQANPVTFRANQTAAGGQATADSSVGSVSADGRIVVYTVESDNLDPNDTNGETDVYLFDRGTCTLWTPFTYAGGTIHGEVSGDGSKLAFVTTDSLVSNDTNGDYDVYIVDMPAPGALATAPRLVSVSSNVSQTQSLLSWAPTLSHDGRYVAFESENGFGFLSVGVGRSAVFRRDLQNDLLEHVDIQDQFPGIYQWQYSYQPKISGNGRFVAFTTVTALTSLDTDQSEDVYLRDMQLNGFNGGLKLISQSVGGPELQSAFPSIAADGTLVAFDSQEQFGSPADNNAFDVFYRQITIGGSGGIQAMGPITVLAGNADGLHEFPSVSGDGSKILFQSTATNLIPSDNDGHRDTYLYDFGTTQFSDVHLSSTGAADDGGSRFGVISDDGLTSVFCSASTTLVAGDTNGKRDLFVRGADMMLRAEPKVVNVPAGDVMTLGTCAQPGTLAILYLVGMNDGTTYTPMFVKVIHGVVPASGAITFLSFPPGPGLQGFDYTYQAFGIGPYTGGVSYTDPATISIP